MWLQSKERRGERRKYLSPQIFRPSTQRPWWTSFRWIPVSCSRESRLNGVQAICENYSPPSATPKPELLSWNKFPGCFESRHNHGIHFDVTVPFESSNRWLGGFSRSVLRSRSSYSTRPAISHRPAELLAGVAVPQRRVSEWRWGSACLTGLAALTWAPSFHSAPVGRSSISMADSDHQSANAVLLGVWRRRAQWLAPTAV